MQCFLASSTRRILSARSAVAIRNGYIYPACRRGRPAQMRPSTGAIQSSKSFSSSVRRAVADKPFYVTTPIFYVNASPHVGHLFTMILADVVKRWEVLKGERPALLCTGTDEHGMKVQQAAEAQELHPKALCDANSEIFRDLARKANIANDHFIRTTDPEHREAVEHFWRRLDENGYIYETKHEGWYCVSDETFYPENMVAKTVDPRTGKTFMASTETGNAVEWTEEKNYHFRMTALRDRLLEFYKQNPQWVRPENRMREVVDWVENNLEDLSISRPASRLQWGIPVPDDPSQTIYVWVDALINYLTYAKYPYWAPGASHLGGWPADVHVIGKDIVRFHCVYWPALLMALDLPLPKRVISHGHWLMDSKKMSKSIGNVVNPFFAMSRWGVDTMRYFLMYNGAIESDSNYNNDLIVERYKKGLQGGLGNLLSRMTLSKKWDVREAIQAVHEDHGLKLPIEDFPEVATLASDHQRLLEYLVELVSQDLDECAPKIALHRIMECVFETNRFVAATQPWNLAKKGDAHRGELHSVVYLAAESLRIVGILLQPFIPQKAGELLDTLGVDPESRSLKHAKLHADASYGKSTVAASSLFPPLGWEH